MLYLISWKQRAEKALSKLPKNIASRIAKKIDSLKTDPFRYLEHYEGEKIYKLRIRDYRALIDVDNSKKTLEVQVVGHRKKIYKHHK